MAAVVLPGFLMSGQMNKEGNVCSRQNKTDSRRYKNNSSKNLFHYPSDISHIYPPQANWRIKCLSMQPSPNIIPINRLCILFSEKSYCVIFIPLFIKKLKSWGLPQTLFIHYPTNWFLSRLTLRARRAATAGTNQKNPPNRPA